MLLHPHLHYSPRLLLPHQLSPPLLPHHHHLTFSSPPFRFRLRSSTAFRAEPPAPSSSAAEHLGEGDDGPVELRSPTLFAVDDNPTPLQVATSVLLTGAISVFLFRSLRRRARRAKELRVRSGGMEKPEGLRAIGAAPVVPDKPPSPVQALLGGVAAGVIALILYKFTTTIEAALNRQTISDNFSVRQITITIRTIVNGLCYLATFVFGINSVGLILYSLQLAFASITDTDSSNTSPEKNSEQLNRMTSSSSSSSNAESSSSDLQQISDKSKNSIE